MKALNIIMGILTIIAGCVCIWYPFDSSIVYGYMIAVIVGLMGIMTIVGYVMARSAGVASGLVGIDGTLALVVGILGVVFMVLNMAVPGFTYGVEHLAAVIMMAYLLVNGIVVIVQAVSFSSVIGIGMTIAQVLLGILEIIAAFYGFLAPAAVLAAFGLYLGFCLIFSGCTRIALGVAIKA